MVGGQLAVRRQAHARRHFAAADGGGKSIDQGLVAGARHSDVSMTIF
jgi:hypothetical protein